MACLALAAAPALAAPIEPYDGSVPFNCQIQDVGKGTAFPDPNADPFCVRFDKTGQNITELGLVDFLAQEPTRVAAALDKCFYYQSDHWTGSIVQGQQPELYNFEGRYYFDLARGGGGVHLHDLRVLGQSFDPAIIPGIPPEFRPYFRNGSGGARLDGLGGDLDPRCVAIARRKPVYRVVGEPRGCRLGGGPIGRGIGGIGLGARRARVREVLGKPTGEKARSLSYCLEDGSTLNAGFTGSGPNGRVLVVESGHPAFTVRGLGAGSTTRQARRTLRGESVRRRGDGSTLLILRQRSRTLVVQARRGLVTKVAVARPRLTTRRLGAALRLVR